MVEHRKTERKKARMNFCFRSSTKVGGNGKFVPSFPKLSGGLSWGINSVFGHGERDQSGPFVQKKHWRHLRNVYTVKTTVSSVPFPQNHKRMIKREIFWSRTNCSCGYGGLLLCKRKPQISFQPETENRKHVLLSHFR